jgi:GTP-binding protein HflX
MIYLYNKIDLLDHPIHPLHFPHLTLSIHNKEAIPQILETIENKLFHDYETVKLLIPYDQGDLVSYLNENNHILSQEYSNDGTIVELELSPLQKRRYAAYLM